VGQAHDTPQANLATNPRESDSPRSGPRRTRLPVHVVSFLLVVVVVVGFLWYDSRAAYHDTVNYWDANLSNSADEQVKVESLWLIERRTDTEAIAHEGATIRLLSTEADKHNLASRQREVERDIDKMARINGFMGGAVADTECRIVAQTGVPAEAREGVQKACDEARTTAQFSIDAAYTQPAHVLVTLASPVSTAQGASPASQPSGNGLGVVVMLAEPWSTVFAFFAEPSRPDRSGETEIAWREDREAVSFLPRLSNKARETVYRLPLDGDTLESRVARERKAEFGEYTDRRGVRVFGVAQPIAPAGASLVRKVDRDLALSEFHQRVLLEWLAGGLFLLLFGSVIAAQHRHLAVRELQEKLRQQQALLDLKRHVEASEERYRAFVANSTEGIYCMETERPISTALPVEEQIAQILQFAYLAECNDSMARMFGFARAADLIGMRVKNMAQHDPHRIDNMRDFIRCGYRLQDAEFFDRDSLGNVHHFRNTYQAVVEKGHLLRAWGVLRDVTEGKRVEDALRESEQRFRTLIQRAPIAISISRAGRKLYVNQRYLEMYGFRSVDEVIGHPIGEQWSPACRAMVEERARQRSLGLSVPARYEAVGQRKDGSLFPVEVAVAKVDLSDGEASVAFLTDITERQRAQEDRQRSFEQLRALAARLQSVREEERKRLAREIHDQLGHALTAIKLDLSSLLRALPADHGCLSKMPSPLLELVDETIESVRRISTELRPGMLDDLGLAATVEWAAEEFAARTGTRCLLDLFSEQCPLDSETATAVFRIFQETLTNVARHANASEVKVRLADEDGDLTLEVHDNGRGIGVEELSSAKSLGILGMRERALLLGGTLSITGGPGKGTTVRVRIPRVLSTQ
jgi:PAS domain S-box-containing protein